MPDQMTVAAGCQLAPGQAQQTVVQAIDR